MKYLALTLFAALSLFYGVTVGSGVAMAQNQTDPYQVPVQTETGPGTGGTLQEETNNSGFNWMWLLPLALAIPVALYFMNRGSEERERTYSDRQYAGMKGGRTRREREEDGEVVE